MERRARPLSFILPLALVTAACGGQSPRDLPSNPDGTVVQSRTSLVALLGEDVDVVGVTVDPIDGERYVLDAGRGLYRLEDGKAVLAASLEQLVAFDAVPEGPFTDVTALGGGRFALTALNDGFLYDTHSDRFSRYFCYVPGEIVEEFEPTPVVQLTRSVTYDITRNLLFAQPQTFLEDASSAPERAEVGRFDIAGGEGYGWISIDDPEFSAGGIAIDTNGDMLLGEQKKLYRLDLETQTFAAAFDLGQHGITEVGGLAVDGDDVLVVDAARRELVVLRLR